MFYVIFRRKDKETTLKVILFYIIYCVLNEVLLIFLSHLRSIEAIFIVFSSFTLIEFTFFCLFFRYALPTRFIKNAIPILWVIFLIFSTIDIFYINKERNFDSFTAGIENILIILLCIYYLAVHLKGNYNLSIYSTFDFWVIIAFLIYLSGTFFLYIMAQNMLNDRKFLIQYNIINAVFNILKDILLAIAMLMKPTDETKGRKATDLDKLLNFNLKN